LTTRDCRNMPPYLACFWDRVLLTFAQASLKPLSSHLCLWHSWDFRHVLPHPVRKYMCFLKVYPIINTHTHICSFCYWRYTNIFLVNKLFISCLSPFHNNAWDNHHWKRKSLLWLTVLGV
jgi:hypothetical protein